MTQFAKAVPPANPNRLSVMTDSQVDLSSIWRCLLPSKRYIRCTRVLQDKLWQSQSLYNGKRLSKP